MARLRVSYADSKWEETGRREFSVLPENPYQIDVAAAANSAEHRPELIILGKSMSCTRASRRDTGGNDRAEHRRVLMYDMAHVLGLVGPHFQRRSAGATS